MTVYEGADGKLAVKVLWRHAGSVSNSDLWQKK